MKISNGQDPMETCFYTTVWSSFQKIVFLLTLSVREKAIFSEKSEFKIFKGLKTHLTNLEFHLVSEKPSLSI